MSNTDLLVQAKQLTNEATIKIEEYSGLIGTIQTYIFDLFGQNGLYALYIATAALGLFVLSKLVKLTFAAAKYLVIPSVALAFAGSFFVPQSFMALLPITVSVCSLFLLFKG